MSFGRKLKRAKEATAARETHVLLHTKGVQDVATACDVVCGTLETVMTGDVKGAREWWNAAQLEVTSLPVRRCKGAGCDICAQQFGAEFVNVGDLDTADKLAILSGALRELTKNVPQGALPWREAVAAMMAAAERRFNAPGGTA